MKLSVVIPTFNRPDQLRAAVASAFETATAAGLEHEVVVVDDASSQDIAASLKKAFPALYGTDRLRLSRNNENLGVTGSKNRGYRLAAGQWVMFLDSDDRLLAEAAAGIRHALEQNRNRPIVFFRCQDHQGNFIGQRFAGEVELDLSTYVEHASYGEALTVVNKHLVHDDPYIPVLRGSEGVGCSRIIARHGAGLLSPVIAREYDQRGDDRLSSAAMFLKRATCLSKAHGMMLREFAMHMNFPRRCKTRFKVVAYWLLGAIQALKP